MANSYCKTTTDWIRFSTESVQATHESIEAALKEASDVLIKEAQALAPWDDKSGATRRSLHTTIQKSGNTYQVFLRRGNNDDGETLLEGAPEEIDSSPYLEYMETGEIIINKWRPPGLVVETRAMRQFGMMFVALVRERFKDEFHRKIGQFGGNW